MPKHAPIFLQRAAAQGIPMTAEVALPWLTPRGHLLPAVQEVVPARTLSALDHILEALSGDRLLLASKTRGSMRADFVVEPGGLHLEYDEVQHFTSARLATLDLYPATAVVQFSPKDYRSVVASWRAKGDRAFAHKQAVDFPGPAGRQRQRAYFDAFRDLVAPHLGNGPLMRIAAPENNYDDAVARLQTLLGAR